MKKFSPAFVLLIVSSFLIFFSCKKINEATTLGGSLIPAVDNVNTFEIALDASTKNALTTDSTKVLYSDALALGDLNDPEFGHIHANFAFNLSAPSYGAYPFAPKKDTIHTIDSVVLSLAYVGAYGDTLGNGIQTASVYEIPYTGLNTGIRVDTPYYRYNDPASDFSGNLLGSVTYSIRSLKDSITIINPGDTFKKANVLRIKLNTSLGAKLAQLSTDSASGGYYNDSLFRTFFNGLSIKASNTGNALAYFKPSDTATKLLVYYRYQVNGHDTTGVVQYTHSNNGQANYVNVTQGGNWANALANNSTDKLYLQSAPSGSYIGIKIPGLDTLSNKVIHRAEIIATQIPSAADNIFTPPAQLILDRIHHNGTDTAFLLQNDLAVGSDGSIGFALFGGNYKSGEYHFNISRYVQGIITRHEANDSLRIYAPLRTNLFASNLGTIIAIPVLSRIAEGRVVLAGGNYAANPAVRLRLRIVYSKL